MFSVTCINNPALIIRQTSFTKLSTKLHNLYYNLSTFWKIVINIFLLYLRDRTPKCSTLIPTYLFISTSIIYVQTAAIRLILSWLLSVPPYFTPDRSILTLYLYWHSSGSIKYSSHSFLGLDQIHSQHILPSHNSGCGSGRYSNHRPQSKNDFSKINKHQSRGGKLKCEKKS